MNLNSLFTFLIAAIILLSIPTFVKAQSVTPPSSTNEKLTPSGDMVKRSFSYPVLSFNEQPAANLTQTISWYNNGTTVLSDDKGNNFSFGIPMTDGTITLLQNSTVVDQKIQGDGIQYDILWKPLKNSNGYVDRYKFEIIGTSKSDSEIKFQINNPDNLINEGNRLTKKSVFDMGINSTSSKDPVIPSNSNHGIGIDWSDAVSQGYDMHFDAKTNSVKVNVGKSFSIDPVTFFDNDPYLLSPLIGDYFEGEKRIVVADSGIIFVFYYDGTNIDYRSSSDNGQTWTPIKACYSGPTSTDYYRWTVLPTHYNGKNYITLLYSALLPDHTTQTFLAERLEINGQNLLIPLQLYSMWPHNNAPNPRASVVAATDTYGNVYADLGMLVGSPNPTYYYNIYKSMDGGGNWTNALPTTPGGINSLSGNLLEMTLSRLPLGKMLFAYTTFGNQYFTYRVHGGTDWTGANQNTPNLMSTSSYKEISSTSDLTNTPYIAYLDKGSWGNLKAAKFTTAGVYSATDSINHGTVLSNALPSIFTTPDGKIHIYTINNATGQIYEDVKTGSTWGGFSVPFGIRPSPNQLTSTESSRAAALWMEPGVPGVYSPKIEYGTLYNSGSCSATTSLKGMTISGTRIWTALSGSHQLGSSTTTDCTIAKFLAQNDPTNVAVAGNGKIVFTQKGSGGTSPSCVSVFDISTNTVANLYCVVGGGADVVVADPTNPDIVWVSWYYGKFITKHNTNTQNSSLLTRFVPTSTDPICKINGVTVPPQPEGLDVDNSGNVWVADESCIYLKKYTFSTDSWLSYPLNNLNDHPWNLDIDNTISKIWVTSLNGGINGTGNRVTEFDKANFSYMPFLAPSGSVGSFGVAVDPSNKLAYLTFVISGDVNVFHYSSFNGYICLANQGRYLVGSSPYGIGFTSPGTWWTTLSGTDTLVTGNCPVI